jgi:hypothetical protein
MANQDGTLKEVLSSKDHLGRRENPFESYRTPAVLGSVRAIHNAVSIVAGHPTPVKLNSAFVSPSPHILQLPSITQATCPMVSGSSASDKWLFVTSCG